MVTGAAAGIGRSIALRFVREGWTVGAYDLDEAGLASLEREAQSLPGSVVTGRLDVRDRARLEECLDELTGRAGRLDVMVNNAGLLNSGPFHELTPEQLDRELAVNVGGVLHGLHAAFPHLRATPGSVAVNLGSASAIYGQAELASYSATKFYVRGLTEALEIEWARHGIRVVDMWPLFVGTAMVHGVDIGTTSTLGVRLQPDDVAEQVWRAVHPGRARRALHQVHYPVGRQATLLSLGSRFSPAWLTRQVNRKLARH